MLLFRGPSCILCYEFEEFVSNHLVAQDLIKSDGACNENTSMFRELHFLQIKSGYEHKSNFL
jgi:hypothetical protein